MIAQRKRLVLLRGLVAGCALILGLAAARAWAESFPRTLDDVKLFGRGETIQLAFSQPFEGMPAEEYAPGRLSLTFVGVGSLKPVRDLRPTQESLYREIKVVQYRNSTTVTFLLRDASLSLKDRVSFSRDKNLLNIMLRLDGAAAMTAPQLSEPQGTPSPLLTEMEQKIAGMPDSNAAPSPSPKSSSIAADSASGSGRVSSVGAASEALPKIAAAPGSAPTATPAPPSSPAGTAAPLGLGGMPESNFFATLATMIVALAIMLGGLYGALYLYRRAFHARLARFAGTPALRQIASFAIGPRQRIVILEINGEWIACGVTPSQITFLTRLSGPSAAIPEESPAAAESAPGASAEVEPAAQAAKADPVHQFAEVLKQKVRSLKRIN